MGMLQRAQKVGRKFQNPVPTAVGGGGLAVKALLELIKNREEREPKRPLGPFSTDASVYATPPASGLRITWMGHSSMLVEIDGVRVLVDPVWDQRASPVQWFGPKRFFAPPLALEELPRLDAVLLSHDHYDHLGEGTVRKLAKLQPEARWVTSLGVGAILAQFGVRRTGLPSSTGRRRCRVTARVAPPATSLPCPRGTFPGAARSTASRRCGDRSYCAGAQHKVYYGADSGWWEGFAEIGAAYGPFDLTMLEIGAYNDLWKQIHMGPDGAAQAFRDMGGAGLLMPIHWGLFNLALHGWRQPIQRLLEIADGLKLWSPQPGTPTEVVRGVELRSDWWR